MVRRGFELGQFGRRWLRTALLGGLLGLMAGCGQKGALVLPADTVSATPSPTTQGANDHD